MQDTELKELVGKIQNFNKSGEASREDEFHAI